MTGVGPVFLSDLGVISSLGRGKEAVLSGLMKGERPDVAFRDDLLPDGESLHVGAVDEDLPQLPGDLSGFSSRNASLLIAAIEEINEKKAQLLYSEIELNPVFDGFAKKEDRSNMNATFNLTDNRLKETFDTMWKEAGINGLNGHRSVGGYRASMYNALSLESVGVLVDIMSEMERKG